MRNCKKCHVNIDNKRSNALFCSKECKQSYWHRQHYPVPRVFLSTLSEEKRKERRAIQKKMWVQNNLEKHRNNMRIYHSNRYKNDINYKLACNLRVRVNYAIKNVTKVGSAISDLGCSLNNLKDYIESKFEPGMTWDNHGKWHIDHIIPLSAFDLSDLKQFKEACNWKNLQPLWAGDNFTKSDNF